MMKCGLFVELESAPDRGSSVERFLLQALPMARTESATGVSFAVRFRRHHYGILDVFPDDAARESQRAIVSRALDECSSLFARRPVIEQIDVLAEKLPTVASPEHVRKALFLRLTPQRGRERELEELMRGTRSIVEAEPDTTAWFALRFENGEFGFFDAFPNRRARRKHLLGRAPRELVMHFRLIGRVPRMSLLDVQAETFAP